MALSGRQHYNMDDILKYVMDSDSKMEGNLERPATKRCRICYAKNEKTGGSHAINTAFICKTFPSQLGLHPRGEIYHVVFDFKE